MTGIPLDVPGLWDNYAKSMEAKGIDSPRVVIHGGYGKNNLGDDVILHVLVTRTKKYLPKAQISVLCHGPDYVRSQYPGIDAYHFKTIGALRAIIKSHIYLIGGGGIINVINVYSGWQRLKIFDMKGKFLFIAAWLAKLFGAETHFYAIGATSFPDPVVKFLTRVVLGSADLVSVRDGLSIANIHQAGVKREVIEVLDPALSLEPAPEQQARKVLAECGIVERRRPLVGLNMRYVRDKVTNNDRTIAETAKLVEYLIEQKNCDVLFIPVSQHPTEHFENDLDFGREVKSKLQATEHFYLIEKYHHPTVMMAVLGAMDFCILERLHAVILTSKTGTPFFTVSYDNKVTQYAKLLGHEEMMIDLADFCFEEMRGRLDPHIDVLSRG